MDKADQLEIELNQLKAQFSAKLQQVYNELHDLHGELAATDLWVHALIATHPDAQALKVRVLDLLQQMGNMGYPNWAQNRVQAMNNRLKSYGQFFDQAHKWDGN